MNRTRGELAAFAGTVRKEWLVLLRYWPNTLMVLLEVILMPMAYWAQAQGFEGGDPAAAAAFAERSGTSSIAGFIYLGWAVFMWVSMMIWGPGASLRNERMQGSLENLVLTPVSRFTLLFGPAAAHLLPTALIFTVVGGMLRFVFGVPLTAAQIGGGVLVVVASIPVLLGLSALVSVGVMRIRDSDGVNSTIRGAIALLCGITYPVVVLPGWLHPISNALPITGILDSLRAAVLGGPDGTDVLRQGITLTIVGVLASALGLLLLNLTLRNMRRTGRLGHY